MPKATKYIKTVIPRALREQVWLKQNGRVFQAKCPVSWCENQMTAFDFQVGHNIPESKGGKTEISNLIPICSRCNLSMGNKYSIDEWSNLGKEKAEQVSPPSPSVPVVKSTKWCYFCCCE